MYWNLNLDMDLQMYVLDLKKYEFLNGDTYHFWPMTWVLNNIETFFEYRMLNNFCHPNPKS